jgi:hypothetical protein
MLNYPLQKIWLAIVDLVGNPVSGVTARILRSGTTDTIYSDSTGTAKTNPIAVAADGMVEFWTAETGFTLELTHANGRATYGPIDGTVHRIGFDPQRLGRKTYANTAKGAYVVADGNLNAFPSSLSLKAEEVPAGRVLKIRGQVVAEDFNATNTLQVQLLVGGVTVIDTGALTIAADNDLINFEAEVTVNTAGASGKLAGFGSTLTKLNATYAHKPITLAESNANLSGGLTIVVKGLWSAAHADNKAYLRHFNVELM